MNHLLIISMIEAVAQGFKHLRNQIVFVGGATAALYIDDYAGTAPRPTEDVDCVIRISSKAALYKFESELRSLGFTNLHGENNPICRWTYKGITVDIMPDDEKILGFSNRWHRAGIASAQSYILPSGTEIFIFTLAYFIASKLEAYKGRGENELRFSPDFEDIILVLDGCNEALNLLQSAPAEVRRYIRQEFAGFDRGDLIEALDGHLGSSKSELGRRNRIINIVDQIN